MKHPVPPPKKSSTFLKSLSGSLANLLSANSFTKNFWREGSKGEGGEERNHPLNGLRVTKVEEEREVAKILAAGREEKNKTSDKL